MLGDASWRRGPGQLLISSEKRNQGVCKGRAYRHQKLQSAAMVESSKYYNVGQQQQRPGTGEISYALCYNERHPLNKYHEL